jgi:hypothetical protein
MQKFDFLNSFSAMTAMYSKKIGNVYFIGVSEENEIKFLKRGD